MGHGCMESTFGLHLQTTECTITFMRKQSAAGGADECEVALRITVVAPPKGVRFCLQGGANDLVQPKLSNGEDISFDLTVRAKDVGGRNPPRFLGPLTQGPPVGRFVYVCSGTLAGQSGSCWTRRAKVPLTGITWPMIRKAIKSRAARLEARFDGTAKDGGPSCATVRLPGGWHIVE